MPRIEIEAAADAQAVGGAAEVHVAAELGIQPASLHQELPRGVQVDVEPDDEFALGGAGCA